MEVSSRPQLQHPSPPVLVRTGAIMGTVGSSFTFADRAYFTNNYAGSDGGKTIPRRTMLLSQSADLEAFSTWLGCHSTALE